MIVPKLYFNVLYFQNLFEFTNAPPQQFVDKLFLTDTIDNMKLPINCVVAGQQKEPVKMAMGLDGAISGPLKGIFRE